MRRRLVHPPAPSPYRESERSPVLTLVTTSPSRAIARSKCVAPDIDGQVIVDNAQGIKPGDKVSVVVTGSDEYDLFATPANATARLPELTY